ncbi:hypothetical protein CASFOL_029186 [Castilleja foliolosa]|uniref:U-box domain-containing protein n=1 Tax=Castilleja foliolosa TaxID=1961234 RepID=A0ABD3CBM8_9LAMI
MDEIEVPEYFICPISLQIMKDPVTTVTGITYDRESIEKWLITADTAPICPVTKQPLSRGSDLTPNHMLRRLIQAWCTANAKNGIDRIPTPKSPLHRSVILKLIRDLNNINLVKINALKKLDELVCESEKNRKLMAETGVAKAIFDFILRCYKDGKIDGLDHALRVLQLTWTPSAENKKVLEENYLDNFVNSVLWILKTGVESELKALALVNLRIFTQITSSIHLERLNSSFFTEIVKVLRGVKISPLATKSALQILIETSPFGRNRSKIVEAGAVFELIEMELARPPDKRTTEMIFCLLAQLCSCADGRQRLLSHAAGIAVAAKRLLRVSPATDDRIMCVMESVARFSATPGLVVEMLRVGGVSKLCMVLQADCAVYLKKKAREILRLHSSDWSNSPCIQVYLLTRYDRYAQFFQQSVIAALDFYKIIVFFDQKHPSKIV